MSQTACRFQELVRYGLMALVGLAGVAALPIAAQAQTALAPTAIGIGVPPQAQLGQLIPLQARLVGVGGVPIPKATIYFTSPTTFLNVSSDAVLAEAVTDAQGLATASWRATRTGGLTIQAEFRGDDRYAPAKATAPLVVGGERQLYVQQVGVRIPGLNTAPISGLPILARLWPGLSAWPIAAALLVVWSLYATVVALLWRIAAAGRSVPAVASLTAGTGSAERAEVQQ